MQPALLLLLLHPLLAQPPTVNVVAAKNRPRSISIPLNQSALDALILPDATLSLPHTLRDVLIHCQATQPVRWNFSGDTAPLDLNVTTKRILPLDTPNETFIAILRIRRVSSHVSGKWTCTTLSHPPLTTPIHIFGQEHNYQGPTPSLIQYGLTKKLYARRGLPLLFPCVSWKRSASIKLSQLVPDDTNSALLPKVLNIPFDPTTGFIINATDPSFFGSTFVCYEHYNATIDKMWFTVDEDFGIAAQPPTPDVDVLLGNPLNLSCTTTDPSVKFEFKASPDPKARITVSDFRPSPTTYGRIFTLASLGIGDKGTVTCVAKRISPTTNEPESVFRHKWAYQVFYKEDAERRGIRHYVAQSTGQDNWVCWSKSSLVPSVAFVRCTNPIECDVRSACFASSALCDAIDSSACSGGCIKLQLTNTPGIINCTGDGVHATQQIAIGASPASKWYNKTSGGIPEGDRLVAERDPFLVAQTYTGQQVTYSCRGSAMFFAQGFYWSLLLANRSTVRLDPLRPRHPQIAALDNHTETYLPIGVIVLTSLIQINTLDVLAISCVAPHWDSHNVSLFPIPLTITRSVKPTFKDDLPHLHFQLTLGQSDALIPCEIANVLPPPIISWTHNGHAVLEGDKAFSVHIDGLAVDGGVTKDLAGEYECHVRNPAGHVSKRITVSVKDAQTKVVIGVSVAGVAVFLILLALLILFWRRIQKQKALLRNLTEAEIHEFLYGNPEMMDGEEDTNRQGHQLAYNRDYEFPKDLLVIQTEEKLGAGAYGLVLKGTARGMFSSEEEETVVAVKTLQPNADITYFKALLTELKIMSVIGRNPHIVNLLGACTTAIRSRQLYIIVEFCSNGSLDKFLKAHRHDFAQVNVRYSIQPTKATTLLYENSAPEEKITTRTMIKWSYEIAKGMEYLETKKVIHGDLASRNVLLTDTRFAKIGDFGLSRQLYEYTNYVKKHQAPLPWRWMALESLTDMEFSHKSDVWAFGVTLWEIFSLGELPYPGTAWTEDFMRKLRGGHRPSHPPLADPHIYERMSECWRVDPRDRPSFAHLTASFKGLMSQGGIAEEEGLPPPPRRKFEVTFDGVKD